MLAHRVNFLGVGGGPKRKAAGGVGWGIDTRCASKFIECTRYDTQALRLLVDLGKQSVKSPVSSLFRPIARGFPQGATLTHGL
jgi:hypothetical protein